MSKKSLSLVLLISTLQTSAWWDAGHMVVAQIARKLLNKEVKEKVDELIQASFDEAAPHCNTFVTSSVWSDIISKYIKPLYDFHSQPHTYIPEDDEFFTTNNNDKIKLIFKLVSDLKEKIPNSNNKDKIKLMFDLISDLKKETSNDDDNNDTTKSDLKKRAYDKGKKGKLISGLNGYIHTLKNSKAPDKYKGLALRWVLHLVGDMHQPLHCITRYTKDFKYGDFLGCQVKVIPPKTKKSEDEPKVIGLHQLWDSAGGIFPENGFRLPLNDERKQQLKTMAQKWMAKYPEDTFSNLEETIDSKTRFNSFDWASESTDLAKEYAYKDVEHKGKLSEAYIKKCKEICKKRMTLAGYRLALLLNAIFEDKPKTTTRRKRTRSDDKVISGKKVKVNTVIQ